MKALKHVNKNVTIMLSWVLYEVSRISHITECVPYCLVCQNPISNNSYICFDIQLGLILSSKNDT